MLILSDSSKNSTLNDTRNSFKASNKLNMNIESIIEDDSDKSLDSNYQNESLSIKDPRMKPKKAYRDPSKHYQRFETRDQRRWRLKGEEKSRKSSSNSRSFRTNVRDFKIDGSISGNTIGQHLVDASFVRNP